MATVLKLRSSGSVPIAPALRIAWTHTPGAIVRLPMAVAQANTAFATTAYAPDVADHLSAGTAFIAQFVSPALAAQTIGVQSIYLTVLCAEDNAANNLFMYWSVYAVDAADNLRGTLLAARSDGTEIATTLTSRTDNATSTSVGVLAGDYLVLEVGVSGTPAAAGGVQGHNASFRFGDAGADLLTNDSQTTDGNPWLNIFTSNLTFLTTAPPPLLARPNRIWRRRR